MAMIYDEEVFKAFRAKAVTSVEDLKIGHTYYQNISAMVDGERRPVKFTLGRIITGEEYFVLEGLPPERAPAHSVILLSENFPAAVNDAEEITLSCEDNNIGASYNPWLIFEKEADAQDCLNCLNIQYTGICDDDPYAGIDDDDDD
jgi:hypothetical protein